MNIPDHSTLCRYRNQPAQDHTLAELLALINCQLTEKGLKVEKKAQAAVIDATIIQTAGSKQCQAIEVDSKGEVTGQTTPSKDKATVAKVYARHQGRYGHRRIAATLSWNKKKVTRLMKLLQLKAKVRPKKAYRHPVMDETSDNILNRRFEVEKPNEKWLTDATGFKFSNGKLYLSPILDVFNRETVAYSMSCRPNSEMVERMLNDAVCKLTKADKVLPHSDRGVLYRTQNYRRTLAEHGWKASLRY